MSIEFICPSCNNVLRVPDEHAGKQARCPECQQVSQVPFLSMDGAPLPTEPPIHTPGTDNPYAAPSTPATGGAAYYRPHRGVQILILGLLSLLCCNVLGIAPWVMANGDLAAMQRGEIDPSGRGLTQAGRILGIIALVLMVLVIIGQIVMVAAHA